LKERLGKDFTVTRCTLAEGKKFPHANGKMTGTREVKRKAILGKTDTIRTKKRTGFTKRKRKTGNYKKKKGFVTGRKVEKLDMATKRQQQKGTYHKEEFITREDAHRRTIKEVFRNGEGGNNKPKGGSEPEGEAALRIQIIFWVGISAKWNRKK